MRKQIILSGILLITIFFYSCKKKNTEASLDADSNTSYMAPCSLIPNTWINGTDTLYYADDSIYFSPNIQLVTCQYMIEAQTTDTLARTFLYFKQEPQTGYYVTTSGGFFEYPNSVVIRNDFTSYQTRTLDWDTIYVWNHDSLLDISFCNLNMYMEGMPPGNWGDNRRAHIRVHK